jgi:hypothetical protein
MWIAGGAVWFFGQSPEDWNPWTQLVLAGLTGSVPAPLQEVRFDSNTVENSNWLNLTGARYPIRGQEDYIYQVEPLMNSRSGLDEIFSNQSADQSALVGQ